ncbi:MULTISPECIES: hypothetical protein [unclassified Streptomyces]|uniref:hypothetical protein n=1 Tax=unclassified Streptomyces TaxID=2593676 RepID=UPI002E117EDF|nr:hypothetical protein OG457_49620 [Streptomyces sp. NBC_01207]
MGETREERETALSDLRMRLSAGLARSGLSKTQLMAQTGLGKTTVHGAFSYAASAPSERTVVALARVLKLPNEELMALWRVTVGAAEAGREGGLGRAIDEWSPHDLEVHPSAPAGSRQVLPGYVRRAHDQLLGTAVEAVSQGDSRLVVLVGSSSTGKTRACWEAVQPLAPLEWRLWHPFDPTRAAAALEALHQVGPRTVVWLNEAQHYLGEERLGEEIAAALHALLTDPDRAPVLVLGTLWPEYNRKYEALPHPGGPDPHSRVRELLAGRTVHVPPAFDANALRAATELARKGDLQLARALTRASAHGQVTQDLAGAPALLHAYEHGSPAGRALLEAAMDARRLGVGLHLPQAFLTDAATDYLNDTDYDQLTEDWAEAAYAEVAKPVHGQQAALRRATPRPKRRPPGVPPVPEQDGLSAGQVFRLADYLEQHGRNTRRRLCPPASFWAAAHAHLTRAADVHALAEASRALQRMQWAHHLLLRAADLGSGPALTALGELRERAKDSKGAESYFRKATHLGDVNGLARLALLHQRRGDHESAATMARQVAARSVEALGRLAVERDTARDRAGAEFLARHAAEVGHLTSTTLLARLRKRAGDLDGAEVLARQAHDAGHVPGTTALADLLWRRGDQEGGEALFRLAADAGSADALQHLWLRRRGRRQGGRAAAEALVQEAIDRGAGERLPHLIDSLNESGYSDYASEVALQAATSGELYSLMLVARQRGASGDLTGAEKLLEGAVEAGDPQALVCMASFRESAGDLAAAEELLQQAIDAGEPRAYVHWALLKERAGDPEGAEALAWQAPAFLPYFAVAEMADLREAAGQHESAGRLYRQLADARLLDPSERQWPHGLDPDGTPTPPWQDTTT